ncbi:MAG: hypothetical protein LUI07_07250, partial [Lachnospiraceae bacterium]|nr:hypothetical protein [Lachnospiraceae bacterium]
MIKVSGTMSISGKLWKLLNQIKPVLKRLLPRSVRRFGRQTLIRRTTEQISQIQIEPWVRDDYPEGINLIGPIDCATGLGQSFRLLVDVIDELGIPYIIYNFEQYTENHIDVIRYRDRIQEELKYGINLWHVNPSEFAEAYATVGKGVFDRHYNIAFWLWELEEFPDEWCPYIHLLNEIWTPSEFISNAIRKKSCCPVYTVPYHVTAQANTKRFGRKYFGLPEDKFLFLMMYDALS